MVTIAHQKASGMLLKLGSLLSGLTASISKINKNVSESKAKDCNTLFHSYSDTVKTDNYWPTGSKFIGRYYFTGNFYLVFHKF